MNRLGMLVDLSHVSSDAMRQVWKNISTKKLLLSNPPCVCVCIGPGSDPSTSDLLTFWSARNLLLSKESLLKSKTLLTI